MKTFTVTDEDYEFLKDLQNELNIQTTDGNATPTFWMVQEKKDIPVPDCCGTSYITYDEGKWTLEESIEFVEQVLPEYNQDMRDEWAAVDKDSIQEVFDFMYLELGMENLFGVVDYQTEYVLSEDTGAFLTKRACGEYIKKYGYNHREPRTYAMTAYRNPELARLLNILKNIDYGDNSVQQEDGNAL